MSSPSRLVEQRMPKRFALIVFSLLFAASVARAADPVADFNAEIKAVEHLRQRTFLHAVTHKTVDRKDLPAIMKAEMLKGLPYSPEDYIVVLRSLQLVDDEPKLLERLLDLYQQQVLAF